jgi:hypothetical protein
MVNETWEQSTTEEKLERLKADMLLLIDAHNRLARDYRDLLQKVVASIQTPPQT